MKKSSLYHDDVAHQLHMMAKKIVEQVKDCTFAEKVLLLVITYLQEFKLACGAWTIHEGTALWLFKQYFIDPAEVALKPLVSLFNTTSFYHEGALKSYSAVFQLFLKRYATEENIA